MQFTDVATVAKRAGVRTASLLPTLASLALVSRTISVPKLVDRIWLWFASIGQDPRRSAMKRCEALPPSGDERSSRRTRHAQELERLRSGQTHDEVTGEGIYIRVPLMISDERAIGDIEAGKQELSAGYSQYHANRRGLRRNSKEYPAQPRCQCAVRQRRKTGSHR